jgi:signal transduction histidine kinase
MTLRSRLAFGLLTIAIILVIPLLIAVQSLDRLHRDARALEEGEFPASLLLGQLREGLLDLRRQELRLLFVRDAESRDAVARQISYVRGLADSLEHYKLPEAANDVRRAITKINEWGPQEYQAALSGRGDRADEISKSYFVPALDSADAGVRMAEEELREGLRARVSQSATAIKKVKTGAIIGMILALVIASIIAAWLTRSIIKPVNALDAGMRAVADGQFEYKLKYDTTKQHEFGQLARSFESMAGQLAELDKLKAEFVSIASHELKTPINVIIGYLQLLEEGIYGPLSPKQREVHKTLTSQVGQLQRLVVQLLDVSRFEAGGGRLEPRPIALGKMFDELEHAFQVLAHQRGVEFTVERQGELPEEVVWDKDRVNEVLGNLLANAFKFTGKGGRVRLVVESDGSSIVMKVQDTGAGIPADQLPRVFEKFYQANNQASASAAGTGLGLAIAKQIVEAHGGNISIESTAGIGTTFTISLPMQVRRRSSSATRIKL